MFFQVLAASALVSVPVVSAAIHDVFVGGQGVLKFTPEHIKAHPGDSIRFTFGVKNHTVTQSTFAEPCKQIADAHGNPSGFFSGYMPVTADQTHDLPQFWIPVRDDKPIWAFCSQGNHCQQGMVFAVNAPDHPAENSFENWKAKATGGSAEPVANPDAGYGGGYGGGYNDGYGGGYGGGGAAEPTPTPTPSPVVADPVQTPASSTVATDLAGASPLAGAVTPTGNTIKVTVGGSAGLVFTPNIVKANPGDVIEFEFQVKNHTVTQSSFASPCTPLAGGFDSGFQPVAADATSFPKWSMMINSTDAIWAYCKQGPHCASGMVLAINSDEASERNFAAFQNTAKSAAAQSGNQGAGTGGGAYGNGASAVTARSGAGVVVVGIVSALFAFML